MCRLRRRRSFGVCFYRHERESRCRGQPPLPACRSWPRYGRIILLDCHALGVLCQENETHPSYINPSSRCVCVCVCRDLIVILVQGLWKIYSVFVTLFSVRSWPVGSSCERQERLGVKAMLPWVSGPVTAGSWPAYSLVVVPVASEYVMLVLVL